MTIPRTLSYIHKVLETKTFRKSFLKLSPFKLMQLPLKCFPVGIIFLILFVPLLISLYTFKTKTADKVMSCLLEVFPHLCRYWHKLKVKNDLKLIFRFRLYVMHTNFKSLHFLHMMNQ